MAVISLAAMTSTAVADDYVYEGLVENADGWTIDNGTLPEGVTFVWKWDEGYKYMKGSAYVNKTNHATNATLTSPVIDLAGQTDMELTVTNQVNYASGKVAELCKTLIKVDGGAPAEVNLAPMPAGGDWTKVDGKLSLKAYEGKKIQIVFNYISTAETAPTWEISNVRVGKTAVAPAYPTGSLDAPLSVKDFIAQGAPAKDNGITGTYVKGYIVGCIDTSDSKKYVNQFDAPFTSQTNLLIAQSSSETDIARCIPVALPKGAVRDGLNLNAHPENLGMCIILCGTRETYFSVPGLKAVTSYKWVGEAPEPGGDTKKAIYSGLTSEEDAAAWTIDNGTLPEGLTYVWKWDAKYNLMKGSAFLEKAFATDAKITSPVIDLTGYSECVLSASNQINYAKDLVDEFCKTYIKAEGADPVLVKFDAMPEGINWTAVEGKIDLKEFEGKKIQIIFNYISTAEKAATWEVSNVKVTGKASSAVEEISVEDGEAVYYNLQGVRVANPERGIYVKVANGKSSKVYITE